MGEGSEAGYLVEEAGLMKRSRRAILDDGSGGGSVSDGLERIESETYFFSKFPAEGFFDGFACLDSSAG